MAPSSWNPFTDLSGRQRKQIEEFERLLRRFNRRHNLVSSSTAERTREHHTLHALTLAWKSFPPGAVVVDWGTGGGLPALPLAIAFPEVHFHAVDSVRKKVMAVQAITRRLGLENVETWHGRAEEWPGEAHFSVSRATAPLADLWRWHRRIYSSASPLPLSPPEASWSSGLLALKGGDLREETQALRASEERVYVEQHDLYALLGRDRFKAKCIVHVASDPASH